jgi:arsenate-mycothiol transferase
MRQLAGDSVKAESAGTRPGTSLNDLSVSTLREVGVDISSTRVENWLTDEPSLRGIEGVERIRMVRDGIAACVRQVASDLGVIGE